MASLTHASALLLLLPLVLAATPSVYNPHDVSAISLYGPSAVYAASMCPPSFTFTARARFLDGLRAHQIGLRSSDLAVNGRKCRSDAPLLVFVPIGNTDHYPPQWHFEHSVYSDHPVNFTCGEYQFSIRYGYFNDVDTKPNNGFLDAKVVYFDFAVIPNSSPFGFCSYSARREDHDRPLNHAPFPTKATWKTFQKRRTWLRKRNSAEVPLTDNPNIEPPKPNPSAEDEATASPEESPEESQDNSPEESTEVDGKPDVSPDATES